MSTPVDEKNTIKLRKDVVKNIAIIFLAVMLILTFFSNSIMNKALPEVAVKYVEQGSVSEKIRGTGSVKTDDPYSLVVTDTRKISGVAVKVGDDVEKDQILFYLEDSDSEELQKAQADLDDLIYKYTTGALKGDMSHDAYMQATGGNASSMAVYEARIEAAKTRVKTAQEKVDSISRQKTVAEGESSEDLSAAITEAQDQKLEVEAKIIQAQTEYDNLKKIVDAGSGLASAASYAALEEANAHSAYEAQCNAVDAAMGDATIWPDVLARLIAADSDKYGAISSSDDLKKMIFDDSGSIKDADALNAWTVAVEEDASDKGAAAKYDGTKLAELTKAYKDYTDKKQALDEADKAVADYKSASSSINSAYSNLKSLENKREELITTISKLQNDKSQNSLGNKQLQNDLTLAKADADNELAKAKADLEQLLKDISSTLDLVNQNSIIREQKEKVEKLKQEATGATIVAPVTGKIMSLSKTAGESTVAGETLATFQVAGKPKTMSFSVSGQQAAKVNPGDEASLVNAWYYNDIKVTLSKVMPDPESQGKNKLLVFNVDGDVSDGASLSVEIGQRAKEYDKVVSNSAIKEDNRGKFVLVIEEKGTPFGTRYKAKRVDVEVLVSDDNISAIEGDLDSWSYVITTSDKPVSAGMQVRLSDNR